MKKNFLTDYFYYTRAERNGALALGILCVLLFVTPALFPYFFQKPKSPDFEVVFASVNETVAVEAPSDEENLDLTLFEFDPNTASKEELLQFGLSSKLVQTIINYRNKGGKFYKTEDLQKIYTLSTADYERLAPYVQIGGQKTLVKREKTGYSDERFTVELFQFNPNNASKEDFVKLGLTEKTAAIILKYREKGGTFRNPEDLKKIYGLKDKDYTRLLPYMVFEEPAEMKTVFATATPVKSPDFPSRTHKPVVIDINQASIEEWQQLRGIGTAFAKRIVNFREKLGGFVNLEQVGETYGLPDSTFQIIKPQLQVLSPVFRQISINTASAEDLKAHPYIDARLAAAIVSYRQQHGAFASAGDIAKLKVLPAPLLEKLKPYLSFE